jgi:hypothetical protein
MRKIDKDCLLDVITRSYLESGDFNGTPALALAVHLGLSRDELTKGLTALIQEERASVVFGDIHPNPRIRALPDEPTDRQIAKLASAKLDDACVYPLPKHLEPIRKPPLKWRSDVTKPACAGYAPSPRRRTL